MNEQMPEAVHEGAEQAEEAIKKAKLEAAGHREDDEWKQPEEPEITTD